MLGLVVGSKEVQEKAMYSFIYDKSYMFVSIFDHEKTTHSHLLEVEVKLHHSSIV